MTIWLILIIIALVALAAGLAVYALRHEAPPPPEVPGAEGGAARDQQHDLLEARGQELLERRIELDGIRGPLMGNTAVFEAFVALEERLRSGEIDEEEFEREKIRLLGGG
jgi:hypothetical protein